MATVTQVSLGREGHYRVTRLFPDVSATEVGRCECGNIWIRDQNVVYDSFCDWMLRHRRPTVRLATVRCAGTGGLILESCTDGDWVGWCPECHRYRPTSPQAGYEGWRQFDPHPIFVAVR
jgi:hypothetical protein